MQPQCGESKLDARGTGEGAMEDAGAGPGGRSSVLEGEPLSTLDALCSPVRPPPLQPFMVVGSAEDVQRP